jgi:MOSC domain-containing protein YiiM
MPRLFSGSARTGFYLKVLREGTVEAGDIVNVMERGRGHVAIRALFEAYMKPASQNAANTLRRGLEVPELSPEWRAHLSKRLEIRG